MFFQSPNPPEFSKAREQTLRNLKINESEPGPILHDFEVLLNLLKAGEISLTPGAQLTLASILPINAHLMHPLQIGLKRAHQKSYPHVHGLYLLLRASGLTVIEGVQKKPVLVLDDAVYQQWLNLSPTERYCTLLETWMLRGKPEILGESPRVFEVIPDNFRHTATFYSRDPPEGLVLQNRKHYESDLMYTPGWHNLGLLELFGLIKIDHGAPEPGQGWRINAVYRTPVGDALLTALYAKFFYDLQNIFELEDSGEEVPFGALQPTLQPYLAEWKNNLVIPAWDFRDGTHIFQVSLGKVWRRIAIDATQNLDNLAFIILSSFKFDNDHLYEFTYRNRRGVTVNVYHPYMEEFPFTDEMEIGRLPLAIGHTMTFHFDFGDDWRFQVILEQVDPARRVKKGAKVLETHGTPPAQYPNWDEDDE